MTWPFRERAIAGMVVLLASVVSAPALRAQQTVLDYYYHGAQRRPLVILLDTLGVRLRQGVTVADVDAKLMGSGLTRGRSLPTGVLLLALAGPQERSRLVDSARELRVRYDTLFSTVGLVTVGPEPLYPRIVTDQFIVQFQSNVTSAQIDSLNGTYGVDTVAITPFTPNHFLLRVTGRSPGDAITVANRYQESVLTEIAHPNFWGGVRPQADPADDAYFQHQWHLKNDGQTGVPAGNRGDINVLPAWGRTTGNASITIAIIELSGFEITHPDLAPQLWANTGETPGNDTDDDSNGYPDDTIGWSFTSCSDVGVSGLAATQPTACGDPDLGPALDLPPEYRIHGTAVAGLAAASADGNVGVVGVCPGCRLMLLRVDNSTYAMARAFAYAVRMGADVINVSLSWAGPTADEVARINEASSQGRAGQQGSVVVFSMENRRVFSPGNADVDDQRCSLTLGAAVWPYVYEEADVITVGSSTDEDKRALNSPRGTCLDLLAPTAVGQGAYGSTTTDLSGPPGYNLDDAPENQPPNSLPAACPRSEFSSDAAYTHCFGGTSAAAPLVAGAAGLMLSVNPCLTFDQVRAILRKTANQIDAASANYDATTGFSETHGYGRLDAHAALVEAGTCTIGAVPPENPVVEIGARLGVSWLRGGNDQVVAGVPGAGPRAEPVLYVSWFPALHWMLDAQVGLTITDNSGTTPDERRLAGALDLAYVLSPGGTSLYFGPSWAAQRFEVTGSPATTEFGIGGVLGLRFRPLPFLALRLEGTYRHWPTPTVNEFALAFGFGVVLN